MLQLPPTRVLPAKAVPKMALPTPQRMPVYEAFRDAARSFRLREASATYRRFSHKQASREDKKRGCSLHLPALNFGLRRTYTTSRPSQSENAISLFHCSARRIKYLDQKQYNHHISSYKNLLKAVYAKNLDFCEPCG